MTAPIGSASGLDLAGLARSAAPAPGASAPAAVAAPGLVGDSAAATSTGNPSALSLGDTAAKPADSKSGDSDGGIGDFFKKILGSFMDVFKDLIGKLFSGLGGGGKSDKKSGGGSDDE